jgi:sodium pump decarboxylase gamma subunit
MLSNLLAVSEELKAQGYPKYIEIPEAAFYALIGFVIVFLGITFLIGIVWGVGKILQMKSGTVAQKTVEKTKETTAQTTIVANNVNSEEISEETVAVITAAIMAYYEKNTPKCEFTVSRIKKI